MERVDRTYVHGDFHTRKIWYLESFGALIDIYIAVVVVVILLHEHITIDYYFFDILGFIKSEVSSIISS